MSIIILPISKTRDKNGNPEFTFKVLCQNSFGYTHEVTESFAKLIGCRYLKGSNVAKVRTYVSFVNFIKGKVEDDGHPVEGIIFVENDVSIH